MNIAREEAQELHLGCSQEFEVWGEKIKAAEKWPVRLEANHGSTVRENQGKEVFPRGGSDQPQQMLLTRQVKLVLKIVCWI